jgi:uracil-DNA glycosylase
MKRIYCVGQAPPRTDPERPFGRSKLYGWFAQAGLTDFTLYTARDVWDAIYVAKYNGEEILLAFDALYDKFPGGARSGGHLAPSVEQIATYLPTLKKKMAEFKPDLILAIGKLSIQHFTGVEKLEEAVGKQFGNVIALPHPSGASSWVYMEKNKVLLERAILLLKEHLEK